MKTQKRVRAQSSAAAVKPQSETTAGGPKMRTVHVRFPKSWMPHIDEARKAAGLTRAEFIVQAIKNTLALEKANEELRGNGGGL